MTMQKSNYFISIILISLINFSCEEKSRSNPFDPGTDLDPSEWAPTNLQALVLNDSQIRLTWEQEITQIEGFRIEGQEDGGSWTRVGEVTVDITQYTDTGLTYGVNYIYRVYAFTTTNQSDYTMSNTTITSFPAPTSLTAIAQNDTDILLEWVDNCSFEEGFRIELQENGGSWEQVTDLAEDVIQYTDTGLTYGADYTYRVYAFTVINQSSYATSTTTTTSFPAPTSLTAIAQNDTDILLEWVDNCSFEEGFRIERQEDGGSWTQVGEVTVDITQYTDTGVNISDYDYLYRIYTYTANNVSNYSNTVDPTLILIDIDGNSYQTVKSGSQWWMSENLKVTHYRNGDAIQHIIDNTIWENLITGAYCYYANLEDNATTYGNLYNWHTIEDNRNIAPEGWHVPNDSDWQTLIDYLGGAGVAGGKMKEAGTAHWNSPNTGATNESGFTALPGGYRNYSNGGNYENMGSRGYFWSSTEIDIYNARSQFLYYYYSEVLRDGDNKGFGFSIRCVKD